MKESELVRQCQKGNKLAQQCLYEQFADRLYRLAFRYLKDSAESEDVVMISFVKIFNNLDSFSNRGDGSLEAWIRRIVVNEALMSLRKRHNFNLTESLDGDLQTEDLESFKHLDAEYLYQLILELPPGYRTVFNLFVVEGFEHHEIAKLLGISDGTSRSQFFKAKELLRRKLKQEGFHYGT